MKMMTEKLTGLTLDWAVAKCEGYDWMPGDVRFTGAYAPRYSTDWARGGPIIEREWISLWQVGRDYWKADQGGLNSMSGSTPLIAAMRCYVASKLGDEVELPEGL